MKLRNWRHYVWNVRDLKLPGFALPYFIKSGRLIVLLEASDKIGEILFKGRDYEKSERDFVLSFLRNGMIFFDVGANFGLYTLLAARLVGNSGHVHSFEPSPFEYSKLLRNIRLNMLKNVSTNQVAVGDRNDSIEFTIYGNGWGAYNTIADSNQLNVPSTRTSVRQTKLDTYIRTHGITQIDFIKIDVEGAEKKVFQGGSSLLWPKLRPLVMCEFSDQRTVNLSYKATELWNYLVDFDYIWYEVDATNGKLRQAAMKSEYVYENLVAVPTEKLYYLRYFMAK